MRRQIIHVTPTERAIARDLTEHPRCIIRNRREAALHLLNGRPESARRLYQVNLELATAAKLEIEQDQARADLAGVL